MGASPGLVQLNYEITPTPSGFVDGHFPDGNDGTGAIPLSWQPIPNFTQKQVGTPFSVNLFTSYLTQPPGNTAVASLYSGTLSGGWTLASDGTLAYSGVGQGIGTIRVLATRAGKLSIGPAFTFESIGTIGSSDTLPPTIPTGFQVTGQVVNVNPSLRDVSVQNDCPSDSPYGTSIPSSGMKECRYLVGVSVDGATSVAAGIQQVLAKADISASSGSRLTLPGHWIAISDAQRVAANGVPNAGTISDTGPVCYNAGATAPGVKCLLMSMSWAQMESGASGGVYLTTSGAARIIKEIQQCAAMGVYYCIKFVTRTFDAQGPSFTASVGGKSVGTLTSSVPNGTYTALFNDAAGTVRTNVVVTGGTAASWSPALPAGSITACTMDLNSQNPMPTYLASHAQIFLQGGGGGWQGDRWNTTVLTQLDALMQAYAGLVITPGVTLANHPWFAGWATQETATGGATADGYSVAAFMSALTAESVSINKWFPKQRRYFYQNFIAADSNANSQADLLTVMQQVQPNGDAVGGPDLVMVSGRITQYVYPPNYLAYHNGTNGVPGPGFTFCSVQNAECTGINPADSRTAAQLFHYATPVPMAFTASVGGASSGTLTAAVPVGTWTAIFSDGQTRTNVVVTGSVTGTAASWSPALPAGSVTTASMQLQDDRGNTPLALDAIVWDWHTSGGNIQYTRDMVPIIKAYPPPFGSYVNPGGITPGTLVQQSDAVDYTVTGYGAGILASSDEWSAARGILNSDDTIIVQVNSVTGTNLTTALAGVSFREQPASGANSANSRAVHLYLTASQLILAYRSATSGAMVNALTLATVNFGSAVWLKLRRAGNVFTAWYAVGSAEPDNWTLLGAATVALNSTCYGEAFASSGGKATSCVAVFKQVNFQNIAPVTHTYQGLTPGVPVTLKVHGRDLANNDSLDSTSIVYTPT